MKLSRLLVLLSFWVLGLAACGGGGELERTPGSALWIDPSVGPVEAETLAGLRSAGLDEVFLEVASLAWSGGEPELTAPSGGLPNLRSSATLVVTGAGPPPGTDTERAAERLAPELRRLLRSVQGSGLLARGLHWDLDVSAEGLSRLASLLAELRSHVEEETYLSVTLPRRLLDAEAVVDLVRPADFLVTFLYGQRPAETGDDPEAWDLQRVVADLERLDALGEEYLLGVSTVGRLVAKTAAGGVFTGIALADLVSSPAFEAQLGMSLEGIDRRVYDYRTTRHLRLGHLELPSGTGVRLSFLSAHDVRNLLNRVEDLELKNHRGQVYFRAPGPGEGLSLRGEGLAGVLSGDVPRPRPEVRLEGSGRRLTVRLVNAGIADTEVGRMETNYVELRLARGGFARVDAGEFSRYDLLDAETGRRTLRSPDVLRLYTPYLTPDAEVVSGSVMLSGARVGDVTVGGEFLAPGGTTVEVVRASGELTDTPDS